MPAGSPTGNADRVLDAGVLSQGVLATGVLEPRSTARQGEILPGGVALPEDSLTRDFFRLLAQEVVTQLPGVPGHGDESRDELVMGIAGLLEGVIKEVAGPDDAWKRWLVEQLQMDRGSTISAERVVQQVMEKMNPAQLIQVEQYVRGMSDEEALERHRPDEPFDVDELIASLPSEVPDAPLRPGPGGMALPPGLVIPAWKTVLALQVMALPQPPGWIPSTMQDGIEVHKRVQEHYARFKHGGWRVMERVVFSPGGQRIDGTLAEIVRSGRFSGACPELAILDLAVGTALRTRLRPDIVDFTPPAGEVYEIKPRVQAIQALAQVELYCMLYNTINRPGKIPLQPGSTYRALPLAPATGRRVARIFQVPMLPGLILYDLYETSRDAQRAVQPVLSLSAAGQALMCVALLGLAVAALVTILTPIPGDEVVVIGGGAAALGLSLGAM